MTVWLICLGCAFAAGMLRQVVGLQDTMRKLAERMAAFEDVGLTPISYQNSITPQWVWKVWALLLLVIVGGVAWAGYVGGWSNVVGVSFFAFLGMVVSGVFTSVTALPRERTHYDMAFHALSNRAANYRRVGDMVRADVGDRLCALMVAVAGLPYSDQETAPT